MAMFFLGQPVSWIRALILQHTTKLASLIRSSFQPYTTKSTIANTSAKSTNCTESTPPANSTTPTTLTSPGSTASTNSTTSTVSTTSTITPSPSHAPTIPPHSRSRRTPHVPERAHAYTLQDDSDGDGDGDGDGDISPLSLSPLRRNVDGFDTWTALADGQGEVKGGWRTGYEVSSGMVVRRKGRGEFKFEGAMNDGFGVRV
ncbi:hypothetical protein HBH56_085900 [Parastagonospora nodorum]|uniref:Uncharacterized protein n=2 Tax=Phaeosphaeria nodorum (strain SN15 / ATCC MYA-4574 / FGSC 10173) TaxID=321614 RepID=A0A7U2I233_PHANO|nr:hypothetical protein SNOG_01808 [Parastagonospora nodorum SN15]KAH3915215.1 hypothetical protein HBH56_085900 [Parastagonospora nodorum]EAT91457.1 hypothetical protein SNOG_01808 [Parastagonospora nodorum SN15]KAH3929953.1 hypothetical protein HBH54_115940 [Parastagonospora nodorum]KAH3955344.1 hypothetical protein HBH53_008650 [Parastagonospora nodorum]KAH4040714.1 hypothetical protein HBI09_012940 [Parastagonospora nodorum]